MHVERFVRHKGEPKERSKEDTRNHDGKENGDSLARRRSDRHQAQRKRKKEIELLFDAKRPDLIERLWSGGIEQQVLGESGKLQERLDARRLTKLQEFEIYDQDYCKGRYRAERPSDEKSRVIRFGSACPGLE